MAKKTTVSPLELPYAELIKLDAGTLVTALKDAAVSSIAQTMRLGKIIVALEPARAASGEKTISKFIAAKIGEEINRTALGNAYKTAICFAALVPALDETIYDRSSSRWCRPASAIINALADEKFAGIKEATLKSVVEIFAVAPADGYDKLEALKETLIPKEKKEDDKDSKESKEAKELKAENEKLKADLDQAAENGKVMMREMASLQEENERLRAENSKLKADLAASSAETVQTLAQLAAELLTEADASACGKFIAALPEPVKTPLAAMFQARMESENAVAA